MNNRKQRGAIREPSRSNAGIEEYSKLQVGMIHFEALNFLETNRRKKGSDKFFKRSN